MSLLRKAETYILNNKTKLVDTWRPQYHLAGEYGWINDPNGFIQYKGVYHQFYQHHPYSSSWGPMHWGHAISNDLVKWDYQPIALAPDKPYDHDGCFSGSAIEHDGKLNLLYTGHVYGDSDKSKYNQTQCLASSADGIRFKKHSKNPVIGESMVPNGFSSADFRDPRVIRRNGIFYTLVGSQNDLGYGQILLYKSKDLKSWQYVNSILENNGSIGKGTWECPDLFSLSGHDVLIFSPQYMMPKGTEFHNLHSSVYIIGQLDIEKGIFIGGEPRSLDQGFDFYAPQVLVDDNKRCIMTAWMDMWESPMPTVEREHNWAGMMILPRELKIKKGRINCSPIEEIKNYRKNEFKLTDVDIENEIELLTSGDCYELKAVFENNISTVFGVKIRVGANEETILRFIPEMQLFEFDRNISGEGVGGIRQAKVEPSDGKFILHIFVDRSSVEVFINDGEKVLSGRIYPQESSTKIKLFCDKSLKLLELLKWDLI